MRAVLIKMNLEADYVFLSVPFVAPVIYEREASLLLNQLAPETTLLLRLDDLGQHGALTVRQSCYFVVRQAGKLRFYKGGEARH